MIGKAVVRHTPTLRVMYLHYFHDREENKNPFVRAALRFFAVLDQLPFDLKEGHGQLTFCATRSSIRLHLRCVVTFGFSFADGFNVRGNCFRSTEQKRRF